jgi:hypothetical protein
MPVHKHHARAGKGLDVWHNALLPQLQVEVDDQFHAQAAMTLKEVALVALATEKHVEWTPEPVRTWWQKKKQTLSLPVRNTNPTCRARS